MLRRYLIIAIPLLIAIAIIYPSSTESRISRYNAEVRRHLERLQIALSDFYHDFKKYPYNVPVGTGPITLTDGNHRRAFEILNGVYIILKANDDQYASIAGHPHSQKFYAIYDSSETVYEMQYTHTDGVDSKDRWLEIMAQACPAPGQDNWQNWQASTRWNKMDSLPKVALVIVLIGLCLLLAKFAEVVWKGIICRLFFKGKNKSTSATETSSIF